MGESEPGIALTPAEFLVISSCLWETHEELREKFPLLVGFEAAELRGYMRHLDSAGLGIDGHYLVAPPEARAFRFLVDFIVGALDAPLGADLDVRLGDEDVAGARALCERWPRLVAASEYT